MARFDLNLLSALDALLTDKNVTRAADRLCVTQPTMSGMLQRLRFQFDDQILVRNGRDMELTPFGAALVEPVREALRGVEQLMHAEPVFDPATSAREFTIMASDYCMSIFLPEVVAHIAARAPGVRLIMRALDAPVGRLVAGEIDLCITADDLTLFGRDNCSDKLQSEHLFSDEFVWIVANDHPLEDSADLDTLLSYPHIGVEMGGAVGTIETVALREYAPNYRPNFAVPDFSIVACMVARSELVGVIQSRLAQVAARTLPIRTVRAPFQMASLNEIMLWHSRHVQDPAHAWFRSVLSDVAADWVEANPVAAQPEPTRRRATGMRALHVVGERQAS
jgi:LysR family transcriptional regulator, nod-box dependent transcriptional activator